MHRIAGAAALAWLSVACSTKPEIPAVTRAEIDTAVEAACPKIVDPAIYKVEKDGKVSWLLATRHVGVPLAKFPVKMLSRLRTSKVLVLERVPEAIAEPAYTGKPIPEVIGDDRWERYRTIVGDDVSNRTTSPQMALANVWAMYLADPLDEQLLRAAAETKLSVQSLEPPAPSRDLAEATKALEAALDSSTRDGIRTSVMKSVHDYCGGVEATPPFDHNRVWLPKIDALHAAGGAFFAIDSSHLSGANGLITMLQLAGYTVAHTLD